MVTICLLNVESESVSAYQYLTSNQKAFNVITRSYYCSSRSETGEKLMSWSASIVRYYERFAS